LRLWQKQNFQDLYDETDEPRPITLRESGSTLPKLKDMKIERATLIESTSEGSNYNDSPSKTEFTRIYSAQ